MRITIATPVAPDSDRGNGVTARRWASILRGLGHDVALAQEYEGEETDLLLALHALRSAGSMERFRQRYPLGPLVLGLTGTDVYRDIRSSQTARSSLRAATRLVVLQEKALDELPEALRSKVRVIHQSVTLPPVDDRDPDPDAFQVCVIGHLRPIKDPFRTAHAARDLPPDSRLRVVHVGDALDVTMRARAQRYERENPRYRWLGPLSRREALSVLARSRCLALTSLAEGGANVISEAIALGVPVLASRVPGNTGLLGDDYPGLFPPQDTAALVALLDRAERDPAFLDSLRERIAALEPLIDPERERQAWADLLADLAEADPRERAGRG